MKLFYSLLFIGVFTSNSMAQLGFDIAAKGQFNSTWLFNQNISEQGKEQDYAPSWGSNYGLGFGLRMGFFSLGMETNFGTYPITESIFNVLATLAYDNRRGAMFRAQFMEAIKLLDSGFPGYENMKSSWAGAMGQVQFMPDNYRRYAVDHDGDGNADKW